LEPIEYSWNYEKTKKNCEAKNWKKSMLYYDVNIIHFYTSLKNKGRQAGTQPAALTDATSIGLPETLHGHKSRE
tara:strand:+ start:1604 stop:1825 length:222 start_codon:yes stop_codon:yes gene_type:complete